VAELIADRYELEDVLGSGGMASVYCAHDTLLERKVALKILHEQHTEADEYVERFQREARAAAQLSHPGIVTVIDRGEADGRQFIVFEYVDGETLKEVVQRAGPMPPRRVLELGLEIGRAIAFAHQQGLVHRDVKPQNVLINSDGRAKVTDFGIARTIDAVGVTETGTVLGTSHYVAPEQARAEHVDAQTDVYSFGVVLYELLVGSVPYEGDNFLNVAMKHVNEPVPSVLDRRPDCPVRLASLVERMMAKAPADRPASMDEVVDELEACLAELDSRPDGDSTMILTSPVANEPRPRKARPARRRRPLLALLLLLLLAIAAAAALFLLTRDDDDGAAAGGAPLQLRGVGAHDPPPGDGEEHDDEAALATDGDPATFWRTESYRAPLEAIGKPGVGVVLDAGSSRDPARVQVRTDTPGFTAQIVAGDSATGPFVSVADPKTTGTMTAWEIEGDSARYYVVWITELDGVAHVNEVTASS
jgi:serine/threonine-protein kinase